MHVMAFITALCLPHQGGRLADALSSRCTFKGQCSFSPPIGSTPYPSRITLANQTRLGITALDQAVEFYFRNPSTQRLNFVIVFCSLYSFAPLHQLCQYVSFLSGSGISHGSIKCFEANCTITKLEGG